MKRVEKQVIYYSSACHALLHILELTYGTLLIDISQEFGADLLTLGVLANVFGFAYGFTALPIGFLADRKSERHLLMLCCLGMTISTIVIGLAPNIHILGIGLLLLGLSLGIFHPVGATFIARVVTSRGLGFGYLGVAGNIGLAAGPIAAAAIASILDWRASYLVFTIPALALAVMFFLFSRSEVPSSTQHTSELSSGKADLRPFILPLLLILTAATMNGFIYRGVVTFLPLYLSERIHFSFLSSDSVLMAGSFTTVALAFGVAGQFLGGYLSERQRHESIAFVSALVTVPLLAAMGNSEGLILIIATATFAFFHFMAQPVYNTLIADYSPGNWRGRIYGVYFFCVFGFGSFSATILGYVASEFGINWVFTAAAGFGLITLICIVLLLIRALRGSKERQH